MKTIAALIVAGTLVSSAWAQAPQSFQTSGTLVVVPATGEVRLANDEAVLTLMVEEQDKDKSAAASRVNQKMKQGADIVRRQDPAAILQTRGYYTYPVYPENQPPRPAGTRLQPVGWRVGQYLDVTTTSLATLPATVAAAQKGLAVNACASACRRQAQGSSTRSASPRPIATSASGLPPSRAQWGAIRPMRCLDTLDFEGSGNYVPQEAAPKMMRSAAVQDAQAVEEPSFEPGETTLQMRAVGKVRFR